MTHQIFRTEGASIFTFKPGDIIIRVESIERPIEQYNENLGITIEVGVVKDTSFRTDPMQFVGVENNLIYLRKITRHNNYVSRLVLDDFAEGWALFKLPDGLTLRDLGYEIPPLIPSQA